MGHDYAQRKQSLPLGETLEIKICQTVAKPYETPQKYLSNTFEKARSGGISCTHSGAPQGYRVSGRPLLIACPVSLWSVFWKEN